VRRLLFLGLGHLSNGDVSIAADFARQLPPAAFRVLFVATGPAAPQLRNLGLDVVALESRFPWHNLATVDKVVEDFRPDHIIAADAFTLNYSAAWSGLSIGVLRQRYGARVATFDQYDYSAADYVVDFYSGHRTRFPRLMEECDLLIRNSPLNRPAPSRPGVVVCRMRCAAPGADRAPAGPDGGTLIGGRAGRTGRPPVVFLTNSRWEYVNVTRSAAMGQLMQAMPRLIHSHLAALGRPVRVEHVGPVAWRFPIADHIDYRHAARLAPGRFHERLLDADLFISANAVSVTLTQAVLWGVPSLLLQNDKLLDVASLTGDGAGPRWLAEAAPELTVAYPFRVFPWGWYEFLAPVLSDNPYTDCFLTAGIFQRRQVLHALSALLDDAGARGRLHDAQVRLQERLSGLSSAAEGFTAEVAGR